MLLKGVSAPIQMDSLEVCGMSALFEWLLSFSFLVIEDAGWFTSTSLAFPLLEDIGGRSLLHGVGVGLGINFSSEQKVFLMLASIWRTCTQEECAFCKGVQPSSVDWF